MPLDKVTVRVPATAANLGPGFDCLGMALNIHNTLAVEKSDEFRISIAGEGEAVLSHGADNLICKAMARVYEEAGQPLPDFLISCQNDIPLRRGLGSSGAAVVAGLVAANLLCGEPLSTKKLMQLGALLEGHPDDIAPTLLGGCQVVVWDGDAVVAAQVPLPPRLKAVLFIPDFEMPTEEARLILPGRVERADAVHNIGRAALLVTALATGQLEYLRLATQDRLHQPPRQALFPAMSSIFEAALSAGALGVFLSGGGSTILALTEDNGSPIAQAMLDCATGAGISGRTRIALPSPIGAHIIASE